MARAKTKTKLSSACIPRKSRNAQGDSYREPDHDPSDPEDDDGGDDNDDPDDPEDDPEDDPGDDEDPPDDPPPPSDWQRGQSRKRMRSFTSSIDWASPTKLRPSLLETTDY